MPVASSLGPNATKLLLLKDVAISVTLSQCCVIFPKTIAGTLAMGRKG